MDRQTVHMGGMAFRGNRNFQYRLSIVYRYTTLFRSTINALGICELTPNYRLGIVLTLYQPVYVQSF
jgi:hypothetical protein